MRQCNHKVSLMSYDLITNSLCLRFFIFESFFLFRSLRRPTQKLSQNHIAKSETTYGDLVLDTGDVEERFDLLPQFVPWPGPQLEVLPQVPLAHLEGQTLFLQFLELFPGQVTSDPGLHPGDDFAQTFVTQFFHLTQDSGTEEYLVFVWREQSVKPNLVRPVEKLYCGKFCIFFSDNFKCVDWILLYS